MARIIPVGFGEAAFVLVGGEGTAPFVTTMGVSLLGVSDTEYVDAANTLFLAYAQTIMPLTSNELSLDRVELSVGLAGGTSGSVSSDSTSVVGSNGSGMAPIAMAAIGRKISADLGRRGKGRSFLPGIIGTGDVQESGQLTNAARAIFEDAWVEFITSLATLPVGIAMAPVILHSDGSTPTPITGGTISSTVGWIRGRIV